MLIPVKLLYHDFNENAMYLTGADIMNKLKSILLIYFALSISLIGCSKDSKHIEWEIVNSGTDAHLYGVHFVDEKLGWTVGSTGAVLSSIDGGKTWSRSEESSISTDTLTQVNFTTAKNGWLVSMGAVHYTGSGGKSWRIQHQIRSTGTKPPGILDLYFVSTTEGWAVGGVGSKGMSTILYTQNGGGNWQKVVNPAERHLWGVYFVDPENGWIVGEDGEVLHTQDGGKQWIRQESKAEQPLFAVHFANLKTGWIVGSDGLILNTINGGQTWERQKNPMKQSLRDVTFQDEKQGWAVGEEGTILHTVDGGTTWNNYQSSTTKNLQDIHLFKNSGWIVGEKGTVLRTK